MLSLFADYYLHVCTKEKLTNGRSVIQERGLCWSPLKPMRVHPWLFSRTALFDPSFS